MCTGTLQKEHVAQILSVFVTGCGIIGNTGPTAVALYAQLAFTCILLIGFLVFVINQIKNMIQAVKAFKEFPEKFAEWTFGPTEKILLFPFYMMKKGCACFKGKRSSKKVYPTNEGTRAWE
mgnify:CR=1 FL=1